MYCVLFYVNTSRYIPRELGGVCWTRQVEDTVNYPLKTPQRPALSFITSTSEYLPMASCLS